MKYFVHYVIFRYGKEALRGDYVETEIPESDEHKHHLICEKLKDNHGSNFVKLLSILKESKVK